MGVIVLSAILLGEVVKRHDSSKSFEREDTYYIVQAYFTGLDQGHCDAPVGAVRAEGERVVTTCLGNGFVRKAGVAALTLGLLAGNAWAGAGCAQPRDVTTLQIATVQQQVVVAAQQTSTHKDCDAEDRDADDRDADAQDDDDRDVDAVDYYRALRQYIPDLKDNVPSYDPEYADAASARSNDRDRYNRG